MLLIKAYQNCFCEIRRVDIELPLYVIACLIGQDTLSPNFLQLLFQVWEGEYHEWGTEGHMGIFENSAGAISDWLLSPSVIDIRVTYWKVPLS